MRYGPSHTEPHMLKRRLPRNRLRLVSRLLDNMWSNTFALANWLHKRTASEQIQRVNVVRRCNLHGHDPIFGERFYSFVPFITLYQQLEDLRNIQPLFQY